MAEGIDPREEERAAVVAWLRDQATGKRNLAATYLTDRSVAARVNKQAEELGRLANCIERGEHLPRQRRRTKGAA